MEALCLTTSDVLALIAFRHRTTPTTHWQTQHYAETTQTRAYEPQNLEPTDIETVQRAGIAPLPPQWERRDKSRMVPVQPAFAQLSLPNNADNTATLKTRFGKRCQAAISLNNHPIMAFAPADAPKADSAAVISALQQAGLRSS